MTLEQALLKIIELQQQIIDMKQLSIHPPVMNPFIYQAPNLCSDNGFHSYPNPWNGTIPPNCQKCGKAHPSVPYTVVVTNNSPGYPV